MSAGCNRAAHPVLDHSVLLRQIMLDELDSNSICSLFLQVHVRRWKDLGAANCGSSGRCKLGHFWSLGPGHEAQSSPWSVHEALRDDYVL